MKYLAAWQLLIIIPYLLIWIYGGGVLFHRALRKAWDKPRLKLPAGLKLSLLTGLIGGVSGLMVFWATYKLVDKPEPGEFPIPPITIAVGAVGFLLMAYLAAFTFGKVSAKETLKISALPILLIGVLGAVSVAACFLPEFTAHQIEQKFERHKRITQNRIYRIDAALRRRQADLPDTLEEMVEAGELEAENLKSPAKPGGPGYFYHKPDRLMPEGSKETTKLVVCDYGENFIYADGEKRGRGVLYANGREDFVDPDYFEDLLNDEVNEEFAEALREAEGN